MTPDLETRRRALFILYRRYLRAERAWRKAQREALAWFPARSGRSVPLIGDPGSRMRRLYDHRNRILAQLTIAHQEVNVVRRVAFRKVRVLALPRY